MILSELKASLVDLSPELVPVHERLVSILRSISAANTRQKVHISFSNSNMIVLMRNVVSDIGSIGLSGSAQRDPKHDDQRQVLSGR